ncbi:MAG: hypothetical protein V1820_05680 [archaeon]
MQILTGTGRRLDLAERLVTDLGIQYGASYFSINDSANFAIDGSTASIIIPNFSLGAAAFERELESGNFRHGVRGSCGETAKYLWHVCGVPAANVKSEEWGNHLINLEASGDSQRDPKEHPEDWLYYDACYNRKGALSDGKYKFKKFPTEKAEHEDVHHYVYFLDPPVWNEAGKTYTLSYCCNRLRPAVGLDGNPLSPESPAEALRIDGIVRRDWIETFGGETLRA